jgi:hypothetical protein
MRTAALVSAFLICICANAQEFRSTLDGRITDAVGAAVSGAKVEIKNADTGESIVTVSNDDGAYRAAFLIPGGYVISVEKAGFKKSIREGVRIEVASRAVVDIQLALGEVSQSVTVAAGAELLETESADRGLTVESNRVLNTPLQGRNIFAQAWSTPGVTLTAAAQRLRPFDISGSSSITANGGRPSMNEVLIDGVTSLAQASSVSYVPTAEATGEFRVQTTNFDAQYGWTTGAVINITSKNGTNEFHGSLFEYLQNTHLDANTFLSNRNGTPRQSSHINTFGGDIGGPIKRNKLFFTYTFEEIRQVIPDPFVTSVPTALQKQGDFSQTYYGKDSSGALLQQTIYDPFTTRAGSSGALIRDPFPGNIIPAPRLNPIAVKVFSYVPGGSAPGDPVTGLNNLTNNGSTRKFTDFFPENTGRVDYDLSEKTRLFVRYSRNALQEERSFHYSTNSALNVADTGQNNPFTRENHNATIQLTRTINPSTVLDFRTGFERFKSESGAGQGSGTTPASLGFSQTFAQEAIAWFPKFNWASYEGAGAQPSYVSPIAQTHSFQSSVSKIRGPHSLKAGGEFRLIRSNSPVPGYAAGNFSFDPTFTGANPLQIQPSSGNSLASFLLGTPQTGFIQVNSEPARQEKLFSLYLQDDIRVTRKLKINLGLRWDYLGPLTDRFNELGRGFDMQSASPLQVPGLALHGGLLFSGAGGQPRGIFNAKYHNFGPRAGAAYELGRHTVLRGGYALVYAQTWDDPGNAPGFSQTTNMVTSIQTGIPANTLTNPFPTGILQPVGASQGLLTALGQNLQFAYPDRAVPYTHQFSFEIQRELPKDFLFAVGYVGSRIHDLSVSKQINEVSASSLQLGAAALTANVPNPMAGLIPGTSLTGATIQQQQLLRPFPQFGTINETNISIGRSSYNAAQFLLYKRLSYGLNLSVAYTISKQIDQTNFANPQDTRLEKVIAAWDMPRNLQINGVYELPFGKGKPLGSSAPGPVRWFMSGWEVSALARIQTGFPLAFPANALNAVPTGVNPALPNPSLTQWFNTCTQLANGTTRGCEAGQQVAWTIRQPFTLQTWSSRLSTVRLPPIRNLDASVMKNTYIHERFDLLFRVDFINATNTPQFFSGPVADINSGNFGRISGAMDQSNLPRFIQFSMKFRF